MTLPVVLSANSATGYNLTRSLRFRSSASAYLSRTPASAGNQQKFTISFWVKRGALSSAQRIINCVPGSTDSTYFSVLFQSNDQLSIGLQNGGLTTTQVFRDPSAWYHIVIAVDATQATAANREIIYVNGTQVTSFSSSYYIAQNTDLAYNSANQHLIGQQTSSSYLDGYLAEFNSIDGQALTPSSFGQTSSTTGVWQPKKYSGTYGTNGFYLPFTDNSALTSGSNAGLGKDFSGNGNYWNTNNISITSGSTYDSMTDVPTLTSATASNFAVANPLDNGGLTVSQANLALTRSASSWLAIRASMGVSSGKWYWEYTSGAGATNYECIGIGASSSVLNNNVGYDANAYGYFSITGNKLNNNSGSGSGTSYGATYTSGDVIGVALDLDAGTLTYYKNNTSQGTAFTGLSGTFFPMFSQYASSTYTGYVNFGQRPFAYTPPTGYVALNTFNLPTPTIGATASSQANKYFDIKLRNGTSSATNVTGYNFSPDFVWTKARNIAYSNVLSNIISGATKFLSSDVTTAEQTNAQALTAFNSDGYSLGTWVEFNETGKTYVDWAWDAGGTGVTNTAGSITSTVSANTTSGFSVVTYTGNGTGGATIGHGLGVAPKMFIVKTRSLAGQDWQVYHADLGNTKYLLLDTTAAAGTSSLAWNNTTPSSTVITLGSGANANSNGATYVGYAFAEIAGYSKFTSYTGNGSSDGPMIYTGFKPRFIMFKRTDGIYNWIIHDTARNTYNVVNSWLYPNSSVAEDTVTVLDIVSNGFKIRATDNGHNASGGTYIVAAFAEVPFKYSLAQ